MRVKIYYHQTDCGGVVYYANYLHFLEEARTELLVGAGIDIAKLIAQERFFVVSRQELDYQAPAFYGDILDISTRINNISAVRIDFEHQLKNQKAQPIAIAKTTLVYINSSFKPVVIPEDMRKRLEEYKKKDSLC